MTTQAMDGLRTAIKAAMPEGVKVPVRTGRKNDKGVALAQEVTLRMDCAPDAVLTWLLTAAARALVAEKLNGIGTEGGAKLAAARALCAAINAGETPQAFVAPTRTAGGLPEAEAEAVAMWAEDLLRKVGAIIGVDPAQRAHAATARRAGREVICEAIATDPRFAAARPFVVAVADAWHLLPPAQVWAALPEARKADWLAKAEAAAAERAKLAEAPDVAAALADLI